MKAVLVQIVMDMVDDNSSHLALTVNTVTVDEAN